MKNIPLVFGKTFELQEFADGLGLIRIWSKNIFADDLSTKPHGIIILCDNQNGVDPYGWLGHFLADNRLVLKCSALP